VRWWWRWRRNDAACNDGFSFSFSHGPRDLDRHGIRVSSAVVRRLSDALRVGLGARFNPDG
jgi:hypothetical protein